MSTLEKVIEEVKALKPEELRRVRELVDSLLSGPAGPQMTEDEREEAFERELAAEGFIAPVEPLTATEEEVREYRAYRPINVEGRPLSETVIEERR